MKKRRYIMVLVGCIILAAGLYLGVLAGEPVMHLQVMDTIESGSGSGLHAQCSRRIGLGMDAASKTSFAATIIDMLPAGYKLIAPKLGIVQVKALDGKARPVRISSQGKGKNTELRLDFNNLPALLTGQECCDCSGGCKRACSIEFTYRTSLPNTSARCGMLNYSVSPASIPFGKASKVKLVLGVRNAGLRKTSVIVSIPAKVSGASLATKSCSPDFHRVPAARGVTRLTADIGVRSKKLIIELEVRPSRPGRIKLSNSAELVGKLAKPVRSAPSLAGKTRSDTVHQTYFKLRRDLEITVHGSSGKKLK